MTVLITVFALHLLTNTTFAQSGGYIDMGIDVSFKPALGLNFAYYNPSNQINGLNYFGAYVIGFDGLYGKGKDYSDVINRGSYPNDVREEGYDYEHFGLRLGTNTTENVVLYGLIGVRLAYIVQNRYDRLNILSNNGEYHIRFSDTSKNKVDFGIGANLFPQTKSNLTSINVEYSLLRTITVSINLRASM